MLDEMSQQLQSYQSYHERKVIESCKRYAWHKLEIKCKVLKIILIEFYNAQECQDATDCRSNLIPPVKEYFRNGM